MPSRIVLLGLLALVLAAPVAAADEVPRPAPLPEDVLPCYHVDATQTPPRVTEVPCEP